MLTTMTQQYNTRWLLNKETSRPCLHVLVHL